MNRLLTEAREAFQVANQLERKGLRKMAYAHGQLAARKIEQALAEGWADNSQFKVDGTLARIPHADLRETQTDY